MIWPRLSRLSRLSLLGVLLVGCAPSLSSFQPAHVPPKGHLGVEVGTDVSVPTGTFARSIDAGKTLARAAESRALSEPEKLQLFAAGLNLSLNPPAFVEHVGVAYSPAQNWELGVRYAAGSWRLAVRRQVLAQSDADGYDVTVGLGIQYFSFGFPIGNVLDIVKLDDFRRWGLDIPLAIGRQGDFYRWWGGPRVMLTSYSTQLIIEAPGQAGAVASRDLAKVDGNGAYLGAQAGVALGYRWLFLAVEMTVVRMVGTAQMDVFGRRTEADTGTWIIYPGIGILGEF